MRKHKKREYVRVHHSKKVREERLTNGIEKINGGRSMESYSMDRVKERKWTLNRSPHGNKTAREQFGRQVWKRRRKRNEEERKNRKVYLRKSGRYVGRKGK